MVAHVRHWGLDGSNGYTQNQIYASFYQLVDQWVPAFQRDISIIVRTPLTIAALQPSIQAALDGANGGQPVYHLETMQEILSESMSSQRFPMVLLAAFAGLALILASIGTYGVLSYSTTRRVREIGIRMALGANRRNVLWAVLGQGLWLALAGVATGAVGALLLTRLLRSFSRLLYGVSAWDPATFLAVSLALLASALLACYIPARRAASVDPMTALRHD